MGFDTQYIDSMWEHGDITVVLIRMFVLTNAF